MSWKDSARVLLGMIPLEHGFGKISKLSCYANAPPENQHSKGGLTEREQPGKEGSRENTAEQAPHCSFPRFSGTESFAKLVRTEKPAKIERAHIT